MDQSVEYTEGQLQLLHEIELDLYEQVLKVCKRHNLSLFAIGGTALGAVRHNGFIPWDDDMDVALFREDYETFLQVAAEELPEGYFLQHYTIDPVVPFYHAKVRMDQTLFLETSVSHLDMHHGVFIDIMPFDSVPNQSIIGFIAL